jgi:hypothetical protein
VGDVVKGRRVVGTGHVVDDVQYDVENSRCLRDDGDIRVLWMGGERDREDGGKGIGGRLEKDGRLDVEEDGICGTEDEVGGEGLCGGMEGG